MNEHEPVEVPITDEIDLHTFNPKDVPDLLNEYFRCCLEKNIQEVRVIHGKGKGILKKRVHSCLNKNPFVLTYRSSKESSGGWGSTSVTLHKKDTHDTYTEEPG